MSGRSDADLIAEFRGGDESAFNVFVSRYQEKVYWVARRFTSDHDLADDIVQEVFVRAYESLAGFRGESHVYTWLYRITVNVSLNVLRRQRVKEFLRLDELFEQEDPAADTPAEILESNEQRALIEQAIELLPLKQKAVFVMRYYDEMPYEEIAKILKTSVGGLKANYFHAVKKIGAYLKRAHTSR